MTYPALLLITAFVDGNCYIRILKKVKRLKSKNTEFRSQNSEFENPLNNLRISAFICGYDSYFACLSLQRCSGQALSEVEGSYVVASGPPETNVHSNVNAEVCSAHPTEAYQDFQSKIPHSGFFYDLSGPSTYYSVCRWKLLHSNFEKSKKRRKSLFLTGFTGLTKWFPINYQVYPVILSKNSYFFIFSLDGQFVYM